MEASKASIRVLVTGVTGFIGSTCAYQLLERGYRVRGTVRDKKNAKKLKPLEKLPHQENFEIVEADLLKADGWEAATKDCIYVLHVASPFPVAIPKDENLLIRPAVDGTLNVLRACTKSKVKKVVLTSSEAAILSLGPTAKLNLTEDDWADLATVPPYNKSKTLAEKAAWDYYKKQDKDNRFELATINPSLVLGPAMISTDFTSGEFVRQLITGDAFALPKVNFGIVDVRDVATAHILAMESKVSDGNRYICNSDDHFWMEEMAAILREEFGKYGYRVTSKTIRYCTARLASIFNTAAKSLIPFWGKDFRYSNKKIKEQLGIKFRSGKESVIAMAYSLIESGIVPNLIKKKAGK